MKYARFALLFLFGCGCDRVSAPPNETISVRALSEEKSLLAQDVTTTCNDVDTPPLIAFVPVPEDRVYAPEEGMRIDVELSDAAPLGAQVELAFHVSDKRRSETVRTPMQISPGERSTIVAALPRGGEDRAALLISAIVRDEAGELLEETPPQAVLLERRDLGLVVSSGDQAAAITRQKEMAMDPADFVDVDLGDN